MFVTGWWPGACLVQCFLLGAICNQRDHAGLVCAYQKQHKLCMKWGYRNCSKNVNYKRPFSAYFQLLNTCSPKLSLSPCYDYGWLAFKLYRATATHAAATRYPGTSWPTIPRDTGLQHSCAIRAHRQAPEQQLRTQPVGHCTRVQDSRTVASTVTRTRILLWWNILYVPVDEHIQQSYTVTSKFAFIAYWSNW